MPLVGGRANGIELRTWVVEDDTGRVADAMARHRGEWSASGALDDRLSRNGLRLVRLPADDIAALQRDLGEALFDQAGWHGQITDWRVLAERPLDSSTRAIALDGRVRPVAHDAVRLLIRGWTLMREDGPRIELHVIPQLRSSRRRSELVPDPAAQRIEGENLAAGALDVYLEPGWAYVLTGEAPGVQWQASAAPLHESEPAAERRPEGQQAEAGFHSNIEQPARPAARRDGDRMWTPGPAAPTPPTIGELMFMQHATPPTRTLLIFIAHVPPELIPATDSATMVGESEPQ